MNSISHFVIAIFSKLNQPALVISILSFTLFYPSCTTPNSLSASDTRSTTSPNLVRFKYLDDGIIVVPVKVSDSVTKDFILDTGIGITMISKTICDELKCKSTGSHTGKRMSGQAMTVPTSSVKSLSLGRLHVSDVPVGIIDIEKLIPGANIGGFLSLGFFRNAAFTIDYTHKNIVLETVDTLSSIRSTGTVVHVKQDLDGDALGVFLPLLLPNDTQITVEVDTGSQVLILNERFMAPLGLTPFDTRVRIRDGKDETGHIFKRYFAKMPGRVSLPGAQEIGVGGIDVMFQKIIYDGLVGHYFLSQFLVTYNLPSSEMIFRIPSVDHEGGIHARN